MSITFKKSAAGQNSSVIKEHHGTLENGADCSLFTLINNQGSSVQISEYGATITSFKVASPFTEKDVDKQEICLGYNDLESYITDQQSIGVTVGRYANRIAFSQFELAGQTYRLAENISPHHLHGGPVGFGKKHWHGEIVTQQDNPTVLLEMHSPDGDMGYPGNVTIQVKYEFTDANALIISYHATTDKETYINLTNHAYFNLTGEATITNHEIEIFSDYITPLNEELLVTGEFLSVKETPFDLRKKTLIKDGLKQPHPQLQQAHGYDVNYVIETKGDTLKKQACVYASPPHQQHELALSVYSTQPCLQFYTGNSLAGVKARDHNLLTKHAALCLEAQDYPNGMNIETFPTQSVSPNIPYQQQIIYQCDWIEKI